MVEAAAGDADITEEDTTVEAMGLVVGAATGVAATGVATAPVAPVTETAAVTVEVGTAAATEEVGMAGVMQVGTVAATAVGTAADTAEVATAARTTEGVAGVAGEAMGTAAAAAGEAGMEVVDMAEAATTTHEGRLVVPPSQCLHPVSVVSRFRFIQPSILKVAGPCVTGSMDRRMERLDMDSSEPLALWKGVLSFLGSHRRIASTPLESSFRCRVIPFEFVNRSVSLDMKD